MADIINPSSITYKVGDIDQSQPSEFTTEFPDFPVIIAKRSDFENLVIPSGKVYLDGETMEIYVGNGLIPGGTKVESMSNFSGVDGGAGINPSYIGGN